MKNIFPEPILKLPVADIPLEGCTAYLVQGKAQQILFMTFTKDVKLPEHSHQAQWGIVLSGKIELTINDTTKTFSQGDTYYIPAGTKHSATIFAGYADITYFAEKQRYRAKV